MLICCSLHCYSSIFTRYLSSTICATMRWTGYLFFRLTHLYPIQIHWNLIADIAALCTTPNTNLLKSGSTTQFGKLPCRLVHLIYNLQHASNGKASHNILAQELSEGSMKLLQTIGMRARHFVCRRSGQCFDDFLLKSTVHTRDSAEWFNDKSWVHVCKCEICTCT